MRVYNLLLLTFVTALAALAASGEAHIPDCTDHINGLSFADPISCSSFYVCLRGRALRRECSHGLSFDPRTQICNLPSLVECHNGDRSSFIVSGHDHDGHLAAPGGKAPCETTTPKPPCNKTKPTSPPPCTKTTTPSEKTPIPSETSTPCETPTQTTPKTTTAVPSTAAPVTEKTTTEKTTTEKTTTVKTTTEKTPSTTTKTTTTKTTTTKTTTTSTTTTTAKPPCTRTEPPCTTTEPPCTTTEPPCSTTKPPCSTTKPPCTTTEPPCTTTVGFEAIRVIETVISEPAETLVSLRDCQGHEDGTFFTNARHCRRFYVCRNNRARHQNCPAGQWFDRELKVCRNRLEVTNCAAGRN
ncbi:integumentary mucin A.1-like [Drosophila hydei]|uniref:Integumentary mucin A.1-like n=1 Tax=Drosophila hydei TaxID=7224 RepID=A0A6J2SRP5_DROHY|nr:integumentary mucin A.1-like [Drosophila hydei]